jgi:hypothetical protein
MLYKCNVSLTQAMDKRYASQWACACAIQMKILVGIARTHGKPSNEVALRTQHTRV